MSATFDEINLLTCDNEPIHLSGAIQPHGILLVVDSGSRLIVGEAGDIATHVGEQTVLGLPIDDILSAQNLEKLDYAREGGIVLLGRFQRADVALNAVAYRSGDFINIEMEIASTSVVDPVQYLMELERATSAMQGATDLTSLCDQAAGVFGELTGFDRIMVYRFLEDGSGMVIGEHLSPGAVSYRNHYFPATDIPSQARALFLRNRTRIIPDVHYTPQHIRADRDLSQLDLSDSLLRSVSPIHIQYLNNMGVGASAAFSIVIDSALWGMVACHNHEPKLITLSNRLAGLNLAGVIARQVQSITERELGLERVSQRLLEDRIVNDLGEDSSLTELFRTSGVVLTKLMSANGFAAVRGDEVFTSGISLSHEDVKAVASYVSNSSQKKIFVTDSLSRLMPEAERFKQHASGVLSVILDTDTPTVLIWFRAEQVQVVKWAGNPHKDVAFNAAMRLEPRASFEAWADTVRGKSHSWRQIEVESAGRMGRLILTHCNTQKLHRLNRELECSARENELLLTQKDYLLHEVNHRVQNSLQLVSSFLRLQARDTDNEDVQRELSEAQKRLSAVALVHRQLHLDASETVIDLSRYMQSLIQDMLATMDRGWKDHLSVSFASLSLPVDKAVHLGLILSELVINVQKYAYSGEPGPLSVMIEGQNGQLNLSVADQGSGKVSQRIEGSGFGSKLLNTLVDGLNGHMVEADNNPGLRVTVTIPIA